MADGRRLTDHAERMADDPKRQAEWETARKRANECRACFSKCRISGQAFTQYICQGCNQPHMHANTATPLLCKQCAEECEICRRCGKAVE